jgi:hypothetical protein
MKDKIILARSEDCLEEVLEGEVVLYSTIASQALYLNESASIVWMLINGERTLAAITNLISDAYIEIDDIQNDVVYIVNKLKDYGAVILHDTP